MIISPGHHGRQRRNFRPIMIKRRQAMGLFIESREGLRQLSAMKELGMGSDQYELISLD